MSTEYVALWELRYVALWDLVHGTIFIRARKLDC